MERELHQIVQGQEFTLHYEIEVDVEGRSVVTIVEHLQMTVIVKGIETDDQSKTLIAPECRHCQGHNIGWPVLAGQVFAEQKITNQ